MAKRLNIKMYIGMVVVMFLVGMSNLLMTHPPERKPMKITKKHTPLLHIDKQPEPNTKPTMFVLTTGRRKFKEPPWANVVYVHGSHWPKAIGKTYDEGWGKQTWPEGAKRISEGFVTIWKLISSNCTGYTNYCFVSEDDAIWPWGDVPPLPKQGFVSFFKEAVCDQATKDYSDHFKIVYKSIVPGKCMPYGAVAHAMTPEFATMLLNRLPMEVPVDHYLWKHAVSTGQGYVSKKYIVYHKKGPSLRKEVNTRPQKPLVPPAFTLLQNEGNHRKFDKPCSVRARKAAYCILFTAERMQYALGKYDVLKKSGIDPKDIHLFMGDKFPVGRHKPDLSNIHIADRKLSLTGAYTWMMTSALESYENAVIIEDDLQLAADFVEYMEWGMKLMDKSSNIFSVSAWNDNSWNYLKLDKEVFMMTKQFMGLGWLVNRRSLPLILNALSNECAPWDLCVHREMSSKGMVSVYPQYARVYHMPWKKGRHFHLTQQVQYSHDVKYPNVDTFLQYEKYICQLGATLTDLTSEQIHKHISQKNIYIKSALSHDYYGIYDGIVLFADVKGQQHVFTNRKDLCNPPRPAAKIAVAIPTYNRAGYVKLCSRALVHSLPMEDVWIFDDHSSDYGTTELAEWFSTPNICVNEKRLHPDGNARKIMEWFLSTDYDWLVTLDSDLIVRSDWLTILKTLLPKTQGVISVYHSGNSNHKTLSCDQDLCEMESLGNAGITWSKSLAKEMLTEMKDVHGYDWGWTQWLQKKHIKQYVPKDSLVLHIGMHGTWGVDSQREKSLRFAARKLDPDINKIAQKYLKGHSP